MLKKLLMVGLLALTSLGAQARIGWTLEQCQEYYKANFSFNHYPRNYVDSEKMPYDTDASVDISSTHVIFFLKSNHVEVAEYSKPFKDAHGEQQTQPFTEAEVEQILTLNGPGIDWRKESPTGAAHKQPWLWPSGGEITYYWAGYLHGQLELIASYHDGEYEDPPPGMRIKRYYIWIETVQYAQDSVRLDPDHYKTAEYVWAFNPPNKARERQLALEWQRFVKNKKQEAGEGSGGL
jgi:hypothetical protein